MTAEQNTSAPKYTQLRWKLASLLGKTQNSPFLVPSGYTSPRPGTGEKPFLADVVITHNEVNQKHGVGVLTLRIFGTQEDIISIRSQDHFGGDQSFGKISIRLGHGGRSRPQVYAAVLEALQGHDIRRVVCIPYYADDVRSGLAIKDAFGVPLCTYIMDDQNVCSDGIPDDLMAELVAKSSLRLAISAELRDAYESKFKQEFWLLPPVVDDALILRRTTVPPRHELGAPRGAIIGNIWGTKWLELLRKAVRGSGITADWYASTPLRWHECSEKELNSDGIFLGGGLPEAELSALLRKYEFAILPSGTLDEEDDRRAISQLSLPSKVPYILATSNTPIIVLGSPETAASRFVERFQIGSTADYTPKGLLEAVAHVSTPAVQLSMRQNAARIAAVFSCQGINQWVWKSLELLQPYDQRFEALMAADNLNP